MRTKAGRLIAASYHSITHVVYNIHMRHVTLGCYIKAYHILMVWSAHVSALSLVSRNSLIYGSLYDGTLSQDDNTMSLSFQDENVLNRPIYRRPHDNTLIEPERKLPQVL